MDLLIVSAAAFLAGCIGGALTYLVCDLLIRRSDTARRLEQFELQFGAGFISPFEAEVIRMIRRSLDNYKPCEGRGSAEST